MAGKGGGGQFDSVPVPLRRLDQLSTLGIAHRSVSRLGLSSLLGVAGTHWLATNGMECTSIGYWYFMPMPMLLTLLLLRVCRDTTLPPRPGAHIRSHSSSGRTAPPKSDRCDHGLDTWWFPKQLSAAFSVIMNGI